MSDDFDDIIAGGGIDPQDAATAAARAALDKHIQVLEAYLAVARAQRAALDQTHEERDCRIRPEHFRREGDVVVFSAPESERHKMGALLHHAYRDACVMSQQALILAEIGDELDDEIVEAISHSAAKVIDIPTAETVRATLFNSVLDLGQVRCWRRLYAYWAEVFDDGGTNRAELGALVQRLDELCV